MPLVLSVKLDVDGVALSRSASPSRRDECWRRARLPRTPECPAALAAGCRNCRPCRGLRRRGMTRSPMQRAVGVEVALALVDEAALETAIGDAERLVGADCIARLDDADAVHGPARSDFDEIAHECRRGRGRSPARARRCLRQRSGCGVRCPCRCQISSVPVPAGKVGFLSGRNLLRPARGLST